MADVSEALTASIIRRIATTIVGLDLWTLGPWVRIPFKAWMFVLVYPSSHVALPWTLLSSY
jgi:hypothetical protein